MRVCKNCAKPLKQYATKYCSNACQSDSLYKQYIRNWQMGLHTGNRGKATISMSGHILRYISRKYNYRCALCSWNEINPITGRSPLEVDHIDGNSQNNTESNLVLLCPNCHALTPTYKNLNRGHGRLWRRDKYVKIV